MLRVRHCVTCPRCLNRYLLGFSPYYNGSYLIPTRAGFPDEYALYCSCRRFCAPSLWKLSEMKKYIVSKSAYDRGYGSPEEILSITEAPHTA